MHASMFPGISLLHQSGPARYEASPLGADVMDECNIGGDVNHHFFNDASLSSELCGEVEHRGHHCVVATLDVDIHLDVGMEHP